MLSFEIKVFWLKVDTNSFQSIMQPTLNFYDRKYFNY